jgi:Uma2 family endonuclease
MTVQALLAELMTEFEAEARWLGLVAHLIINGSNDQMSWLGLHQARMGQRWIQRSLSQQTKRYNSGMLAAENLLMLQYQPPDSLSEDDLPYSDDQPVDNELQLLLPVLLRAILARLWAERQDWFFGVNIGLYYDTQFPAICPDAFLALGAVRYKREQGRLSYVVAQENNIVPQWVLEIVSQHPGGEYDNKFEKYAQIGVLYYVVYNPDHWQRDQHQPFEVYRLEECHYVPQQGNPFWMPELGLGIGTERGLHEGLEREWLYWYDELGHKYLPLENLIVQERQLRLQEHSFREQPQQAQRAQQEAEQVVRTLVRRQLSRQLGLLPDAALDSLEQLSMPQLDALSEAIWGFTSAADFSAWLQNTLSQRWPVPTRQPPSSIGFDNGARLIWRR